jgi:hypothetical protein
MVYELLADLVVAVHVAYVSYVVLGQLAIVAGLLLRWGWVRNPIFRLSHLLAILIVAGEALLDITCPLTVWEDRLRSLAGHDVEEGSFIGRFLHDLMFYDLEPAVFTWIYVGFAALVLVTLLVGPPRWRRQPTATVPSLTGSTDQAA